MATNKALKTRLRLLDAARELFARDGFETTTMRAIATHAGVSLGLTYRYFPDLQPMPTAENLAP